MEIKGRRKEQHEGNQDKQEHGGGGGDDEDEDEDDLMRIVDWGDVYDDRMSTHFTVEQSHFVAHSRAFFFFLVLLGDRLFLGLMRMRMKMKMRMVPCFYRRLPCFLALPLIVSVCVRPLLAFRLFIVRAFLLLDIRCFVSSPVSSRLSYSHFLPSSFFVLHWFTLLRSKDSSRDTVIFGRKFLSIYHSQPLPLSLEGEVAIVAKGTTIL